MYKDYYRLQTEPFGTHPNTDTFFISETHKEAWYYLLFGIDTQEPFLLLTGEYGMGKTLLCLRLIKVLKEKGLPRVLYIPTSNEGYGGILRRMASSLGISTTPEDEEILQEMIYDRFRADTEHSRFYLIIDDAHELDKTSLTKLKYLSTFNHDEYFPVIMIFVAHPSFLQDLRSPALLSLNQRIKRRCHLAKFTLEDTKNYIYFHMKKSGATGVTFFPDETIRKIYEYSGGVPRLINNISDTCLLIAASKQLISIPPAIVDYAKNMVEGTLTEKKSAEGRTDAVVKEAGTEADSKDDTRTIITFSEDLPAGNAVKQAPIFSTTDEDEYQPEMIRPKVSVFGKKIRKAVILAAVVLLLILAVSWLYQYSSKIITFLLPNTSETTQNTPVPPEKAAVDIPTEKTTVGIPTLREEMTDKSSSQTQASEARRESMTPVETNTSSKQTGRMDARPSSKKTTVSTGIGEKPADHPFSLRYSSYNQKERTFQEISEIRQLGLTPYLVKVDLGGMGTWWRIYSGFYSTQEEANKVKMTYKLETAMVQKTEYTCQVGEFSNEVDGMNIFERLKQAGYFPYAIQKGRNLFRMYLGAYEKRSEAEAMQRELQEKGIKSQLVKR